MDGNGQRPLNQEPHYSLFQVDRKGYFLLSFGVNFGVLQKYARTIL